MEIDPRVLRRRARQNLYQAIKRGDVVRSPFCETCGRPDWPKPLHAHHPDYSNQLLVVWLCPQCHGVVHKKTRRVTHNPIAKCPDPPTSEEIIALRKRMGLELKEFSALIGCGPETVESWEQGTRRPYTREYVVALHELLNS